VSFAGKIGSCVSRLDGMSSRGIGRLYETPNSIIGMGYIAVFIQP
jgi:hypothetical protein